MAYGGIIKKSRTYDALALMTAMTAVQPLMFDMLPMWGLSPKWVSLSNIVFIGWLAYLRVTTTGTPGSEAPDGIERRS